MKLEGSYDVPAPRAKVWDAFLDPKQLKKAIPGCEKLEALGNDEYKATLKIGVAAVKGTFEGKVRLADRKPPESYRLRAQPVLPEEAQGGGGHARRGPDPRRLVHAAVHDQGRAEGEPGGEPTVGRRPRRAVRRRAPRPHDVGDDGPSARVPRHPGGL